MLLFSLALSGTVFADNTVRVVQPAGLKELYASTDGLIESAPALFGIPPAGRSMLGEVVYAPSSDLTACEPLDPAEIPDVDPANAKIIMVDRGGCNFVEKVRHVQEVGGMAAIIRDNVNEPYLPFMADDGTGGDITIPSVLIHFDDGANVKEYHEAGATVLFKMTWQIPNPDSVVEWMMWSTPLDPSAVAFKQVFGEAVRSLGTQASYTPHYVIMDGKTLGCTADDINTDCGNQCTNEGRYCSVDPEDDLTGGLSGADNVKESLRQICMFEVLEAHNETALWWDYVRLFPDRCPPTPEAFGVDCSFALMKEIGVNTDEVEACILESKGTDYDGENNRLEWEIGNITTYNIRWWPTMYINQAPYVESLTCTSPIDVGTCGPLNMICAGYAAGTTPCACIPSPGCPLCTVKDTCGLCLAPDDPSVNKTCTSSNDNDSVSAGTMVGVLIVCGIIAAVAVFLYMRKQQQKMRDDIDNLLAQYQPMDAPEATPMPKIGLISASAPASDEPTD